MLLRTEETTQTLTTRVTLKSNVISVYHPERNGLLIDRVKSLGYTWEPPVWRRTIDTRYNGMIEDRYVEVAYTLLINGFLIDVDPQYIEKIVNADFQDEQKRWIKYRSLGEVVVLYWEKSADLYHAAKSIRGAKYDPPNVIVPTTSYQEIRDFAAVYNFSISTGAENALNVAEEKYETTLLVIPKRKVKHTPPKREDTFGVDESLRDD
jgi:hypothetical protein